jgi:hypothetical protein
MGLLLILPILVSGYLVCMGHPYHFSKLHRYDGQLLYLLVARLGLFCFLFAILICGALLYLTKLNDWFDYQTLIENKLIALEYVDQLHAPIYAFLVQASVLSFFVPWPWNFLAKVYGYARGKFTHFPSAATYYKTRNLLDSPLGTLMYDSISPAKKVIMLSMSDRKVYVGRVSQLGEASEKESPYATFEFIPKFSGYRDKDTLKVKLTTDYPGDESIKIILREENISTATPWSQEMWAEISRKQGLNEVPRQSLRTRLDK